MVFTFGFLLCAALLSLTLWKTADRTDLQILLRAATRLDRGETVYDLSDRDEHTKPPLATLLFVPLSQADPATVRQVWDGLNIIVFIALAWYLTLRCWRERRIAISTGVVLSLLLLLNPWNKEVRLGQYNVLTLAALLMAGVGVAWTPLAWLRGGLVTVALLLKPTNVLFLPWLWRHARGRSAVIRGVVAALFALLVWYLTRYGAIALWRDTLAWVRFLPQSAAKHLHQEDNFGLPRWLDEEGLGRWTPVAWIVGWTAVFLSAFRAKRWLVGFAVAGAASIVLSPMAWFQNYTLLLPLAVYLLAEVFSREAGLFTRIGDILALLFLYAGLEVNPALCGPGIGLGACHALVPLWSLLAAGAVALLAPAGNQARRLLAARSAVDSPVTTPQN